MTRAKLVSKEFPIQLIFLFSGTQKAGWLVTQLGQLLFPPLHRVFFYQRLEQLFLVR